MEEAAHDLPIFAPARVTRPALPAARHYRCRCLYRPENLGLRFCLKALMPSA